MGEIRTNEGGASEHVSSFSKQAGSMADVTAPSFDAGRTNLSGAKSAGRTMPLLSGQESGMADVMRTTGSNLGQVHEGISTQDASDAANTEVSA